MNNNKLFFALILFCSVIVLTPACRKSDREKDVETESSEDNAAAENAFADVFTQLQLVTDTAPEFTKFKYSPDLSILSSSCPTVTVTPAYPSTSFPKTVIIDYGASNCSDANGNARKGSIKAVFTGKLKKPGSSVNITFNNYYFNDKKIDGAKTITNNGYNADSDLVFLINVKNASISGSNGTIYWASKRTRIWTDGDTTKTKADDVFKVTGTASGTGIKGTPFSISITDPLVIKGNCKYITSGKFTLTPEHFAPRFFDYGTGVCDNSATVSINGTAYSITLK